MYKKIKNRPTQTGDILPVKLQDHDGKSVSSLREERVFPPSSCGLAPTLSQHLRLTLPRPGLPCAHSQQLGASAPPQASHQVWSGTICREI